jgi:hypothetical protein
MCQLGSVSTIVLCHIKKVNVALKKAMKHRGEGERSYSSTLSLTSALAGCGWLTLLPGRFTSGKKTRHLLHCIYYFNLLPIIYRCLDSVSLRAGRPRDRIPVGGKRSLPPGVKRPGRGVNHPPPASAEVKEKVQLYVYAPSEHSRPVPGRTLPLPLPITQTTILQTEPT